ncbi:hypothetical protein [Dyadobacter crusticola]|uniref:hypothetical protein n=1 Tax=Dyadobacter crusticola TaxID=292407 RepID=UPI0004E1AFE8|nr:hypothetical protein [Dyadobacter crusticola]
MKTNQFETTIRRKLESIQPDFQEADWAKMQNYMHAHTPPGFWQQYGSWIGYAAAASVTAVMAFLYVNQLSQNNSLVADVKNLKEQIEVIKQQPAAAVKADTIYIVQKADVDQNQPTYPTAVQKNGQYASRSNAFETKPKFNAKSRKQEFNGLNADTSQSDFSLASGTRPEVPASSTPNDLSYVASDLNENGDVPPSSPTLENFAQLSSKTPLHINSGNALSRKMNYELANRLSMRQVQRAINWNSVQIAKATSISDKKVERTAKAENVVPKLDIKAPYRFGGGVQMEANGTAKTVLGEVLIAKKFSITAGISWLKVKPMEFISEKIFREKVRKDFKRSNPGEVPLALDVFNIKVNPTLVQIPLTVAFRNNLKDNWAYYAGVGANVTVSSKEKVSFDCIAPNKEYFKNEFDKKNKVPAVSSVNFSVGIEKSWHPIVVQAEGYVYTYFTPLTPLSHSAGPGVKLKLLYQIGGKM